MSDMLTQIMAYSDHVVRRFRHPSAAGRLQPGTGVVQGRAGKAAHGAVVDLWLRIEDERVSEARFEAFGCPATIASADWLAEWLPGRSLEEAAAVTGVQIARQLELAAEKTGMALLVEDALKAALARPVP